MDVPKQTLLGQLGASNENVSVFFNSVINYGVKKQTGKSPLEHALAYAEEKILRKSKRLVFLLSKKQDLNFVRF